MNRRGVLSKFCSALFGLIGILLYVVVLTNGRFW